jgi:hypothetical protein
MKMLSKLILNILSQPRPAKDAKEIEVHRVGGLHHRYENDAFHNLSFCFDVIWR